MSKFVHLHTHSHYSLLDGMSKIPDLVDKAKKDGMTALAVTDHGNLYGAIEFYKACKAAKIKPILGIEAYISPGDHTEKTNGANGSRDYFHLILLVKNQTGWENLLKLSSESWLNGFYYKPRMDKKMLREHHEGLIALSGCLGGEISQALLANNNEQAEKIALEYQEIFGKENYYIEIQKHDNTKDIVATLPKQVALAKKLNIPMVATCDSHYLNASDREPHDILLAIQTNKKVTDKERMRLEDDFSFLSQEEALKKFAEYPEAIENTVKIADACNLEIELGKILLPRFATPDGSDSKTFLRNLVEEKINARYPNPSTEVKERVEYELGVIEKTGFADYFLIVQDFINWAKDRGVVVGPGRGSAAGSIISYILNITDLDPIAYELLFERFLNPERIQMPDIDIDIADTRRGEVFGYIQEKYGADHVAHIITFGTMAARAAIRDVGRALDIELPFCDRMSKLIPFNKDLDEALKEVDELSMLYKTDERAKRIIDSARRLEGVARHASVHACGTLISADQLVKRVPLQHAPADDTITLTQFEMHSIDDLGLLKIDLLGLKNLTIIEDTIRLIKEMHPSTSSGQARIDIGTIPLNDKGAFELFQRADTVGVFQLESGGIRRYLKELKPTELNDIIAMVSLYRPGPMELIPSYIARKHGKETVTYLDPKLEPILRNTYGIGIYQEQMMRIASDLAGYTLAEADTLRKAIGKKIKKLLDEQEQKLVNGMIKNGIPERTARLIWGLFPPFARYGFNKSHAACYAMIAYRTAYLKAHYPTEFMTALFNSESGDIERITSLIAEAKKMEVKVLAPDINKSSSTFTPEGKNVRFGLSAIKNVGENIVGAIIETRNQIGEFTSFENFIGSVKHKDLNKKSLESMIKCGALDSFGIERNQLLANIEDITKYAQASRKETESNNQSGLFGVSFKSTAKPKTLVLKPAEPATPAEKLLWEKELLGLYVSEHPLTYAKEKMSAMKPTLIKSVLAERSNIHAYRIAGMVASVKSIVTKTGKPMCFAKIEDTSGAIEVVIFSDTYATCNQILQEGKIVALTGRLSFRNGEPSIVCENIKELT